MRYAKLIDGQLIDAPSLPEGEQYDTAPDGYLPAVDSEPGFPPLGRATLQWIERDGQIVREWVRGPFEISKRNLHQAIEAAGKDAEFHAYLASKPGAKLAYDEAPVLMSNDPLILDALPTLATLLPEGASVTDFLRSCEVGP